MFDFLLDDPVRCLKVSSCVGMMTILSLPAIHVAPVVDEFLLMVVDTERETGRLLLKQPEPLRQQLLHPPPVRDRRRAIINVSSSNTRSDLDTFSRSGKDARLIIVG